MAYTRFSFRDDEERIEFLIALPVLALFGFMIYHFVFGSGDSAADFGAGFGAGSVAAQVADIDGDGVADAEDHCTTSAGPEDSFGCPEGELGNVGNNDTDLMALDTDGDGVTDAADRCPEQSGSLPEYGCPSNAIADAKVEAEADDSDAELPVDSDADGVTDDIDECPGEAGDTETGCPAVQVEEAPVATPVVSAPDSDSDGVEDANDECPTEAGSESNNGCPADTDGDGVLDNEDLCPQSAGVSENRGCPADSDADGLPDAQDQCPDQRGPVESGGCPADKDGDGVEDALDQCADIVGDADNDGCPTDSDGDGVADNVDECPDEDGNGKENGCPDETLELETLGADISFETASATLTQESQELLDVVANILNKYETVKLLVEGHTDDQGRPEINLKLSEQRARACTSYLARQGVAEERMEAVGLGDTQPLVPNTSEENRKRNRRVEFKLTN